MQICPHLFYSSEFSLIFHHLLLRRTIFLNMEGAICSARVRPTFLKLLCQNCTIYDVDHACSCMFGKAV